MKKIVALSALLAFACLSLAEEPSDGGLDYGDSKSSTLVVKAWQAMEKSKYEDAINYTAKCAELYEEEAKKMQASLSAWPSSDERGDYRALNDVGTCYHIRGEALMKLGRGTEALAAYKAIRDEFGYSQAWDEENGWYWSVSLVAEGKIEQLENPARDF